MTIKAFWKDPYQTQLISKVSAISGNEIQLAETIFYAESGGQESDQGTIDGIPVIQAKKQDQHIIYTLESAPTFNVGDEVETLINWTRRHALMKLHFSAEVVLELFTQTYPNIEKIGAHISQDKSRIDFEWHESISSLLPDIQDRAQALLNSDAEIKCDFFAGSTDRRFWQVEGFAQVPCGGTHLSKTSEVGNIKLKRKNIGKGKERVEISLV